MGLPQLDFCLTKNRCFSYCLYVLCLLAAGLLVAWMFKGSDHDYVDYSIKSGDFQRAVHHYIPDIVVCPARELNSPYAFNVKFNEPLVSHLKIPPAEMDGLMTHMFEKERSYYRLDCLSSNFRKYCRSLRKTFPINPTVNPETDTSEAQRKLLSKSLISYVSKKMGLYHVYNLFLALIEKHYFIPFFNKFTRSNNNHTKIFGDDPWYLIDCYIYKSDGKQDLEARKLCLRNQRLLWVDNRSLCAVIEGRKVGKLHTPYIGFDGFGRGPIEYWIGSLDSMTLNPENFVSNFRSKSHKFNSRVSGVGYYWMVEKEDKTGIDADCAEQPYIHGYVSACKNDKKLTSMWYYGLSYQERPLDRVWIYPKTLRTLEKKASFTLYTQLQFAASLFSCFIGISLMQIIQLVLTKIKKSPKFNEKEEKISQALAFAVLFLVSATLTGIDLRTYFRTRYMTVFREEEVKLPIPTIQFCNDHYTSYGFTNITKMYEYNISLELYTFLRYVGWLNDPMVNLLIERYDSNGTAKIVHKWMVKNYPRKMNQTINCSQNGKQCEAVAEPFYGTMLYERRMYTECTDYFMEQCFERTPVNISSYEKLTKLLNAQSIEFSKKLGFKNEARVVDLVRPFYLDLNALVSKCSIGGQEIPNCGRFAKYSFEKWRHSTCLVVRIDPKKIPKTVSTVGKAGIEGALKVSLNVEEYNKHSDLNGYYGPGTRKQRDKFLNDSICSRNFPVQLPLEKKGCQANRSWKVKVTHPEWYMKFMQILHDERGLANPESHRVELQMHRNTKLPTASGNSCLQQSQNTCPHPREQMGLIFKAVQMHIWCGCMHCFYDKAENAEGFFSQIERILGNDAKCCRISDLTKCYLKYLTKLEVNKTASPPAYIMNENFRIVNNFNLHMTPFDNPKEWEKVSYDLLSKSIINFDKLDKKAAERLIEKTQKCFTPPCDEYHIDSASYQNEKTNGKSVDITVLYVSNEAVGTEQVDRLDPAQFIGVIMCTYSFTFGIGIVGLCELSVILWKRLKGKKYELHTDDVVQDHLIRSAGIFTGSDSKVSPEDSKAIGNKTKRNESVKIKSESSKKYPTVKEKVGNADQPQKLDEQKVDIVEIEGSNKSPGNVNGGKNENEHGEGRRSSSADDAVETVDEEKGPQNQPISGQQIVNGTLMIGAFILNSVVMAVLLFYFFQSADMVEYSADVENSPHIQPPSIALCSENYSDAAYLINNGSCAVRGQNITPCIDIFKTVFKAPNGPYCFMIDNSQKHEQLLQQTADVILTVDKKAPLVMLGAYSLNYTDLSSIRPYFEWREQSMLFEYSTDLKYRSSNCQKEPTTPKLCKQCDFPSSSSATFPPNNFGKEQFSLCCNGAKMMEPIQFTEKPCITFKYSISLSMASVGSQQEHKTVTFRPQQDNVVVFSVKQKHDFASLFSIVGGFFGSFIEVTILSLACLAFLAIQRIPGVKKLVGDETDSSGNEGQADTGNKKQGSK